MSNIEAAQKARTEKALSQLIRVDGAAVMTKKQWIHKLKSEGAVSKTEMVPELMFDRRKYNRMTCWKEQEIYERRCTDKTKIDYRIYTGEDVFYSVSKTEYDYFNSIPQEIMELA
jgi:hypothetical protein